MSVSSPVSSRSSRRQSPRDEVNPTQNSSRVSTPKKSIFETALDYLDEEPTPPRDDRIVDTKDPNFAPSVEALRNSLQSTRWSVDNLSSMVNNLNAKVDSIDARMPCRICEFRDRTALIRPCGHRIACLSCLRGVEKCPSCRVAITELEEVVPSLQDIERALESLDIADKMFNYKPSDSEIRAFQLEQIFMHRNEDSSGLMHRDGLDKYIQRFTQHGLDAGPQEINIARNSLVLDKNALLTEEEFVKFMMAVTKSMSSRDFLSCYMAIKADKFVVL
eukprot:TRINITY_DN22528_c0_g1_i1.p1 TRINITY_DN22528_c0_g1~~TRINITY_DN22528_c0_g1_i1.p1  ORF type:complete len:276 (-),score=5.78 TRINITY_DN22528_c0_g1_i1:40-867(-)